MKGMKSWHVALAASAAALLLGAAIVLELLGVLPAGATRELLEQLAALLGAP